MKRNFIAVYFTVAMAGITLGNEAIIGWPEVVDLLTQEKVQAITCAGLVKARAKSAVVQKAEDTYNSAKASADGAIAGLLVALAQGGEPDDLPRVKDDIASAGAGLESLCKSAREGLSEGVAQRGIFEDIAKAAVQPVLDKLSEGVSAVWSKYSNKNEHLVATIKTGLESAQWPEFGVVKAFR
jgi:hypothetical protein